MLPLEPKVPDEPVPFYLGGVVELQQKAVFWTRLATAASVLTAFVFLALALYQEVRWLVALPFFVLPFIPIAAETRVAEIKRVIDRQLLDRMAERSAGPEAEAGTP